MSDGVPEVAVACPTRRGVEGGLHLDTYNLQREQLESDVRGDVAEETQSGKGRVNEPKGGIEDVVEKDEGRHLDDGATHTQGKEGGAGVGGKEAPRTPFVVCPECGPATPATKVFEASHPFPMCDVGQLRRLHRVW